MKRQDERETTIEDLRTAVILATIRVYRNSYRKVREQRGHWQQSDLWSVCQNTLGMYVTIVHALATTMPLTYAPRCHGGMLISR